MNAYCYGPYVHIIEFATFQARCQMNSLPSGKRGDVSCLLVLILILLECSLLFLPCSKPQKVTPSLGKFAWFTLKSSSCFIELTLNSPRDVICMSSPFFLSCKYFQLCVFAIIQSVPQTPPESFHIHFPCVTLPMQGMEVFSLLF